MKDVFFTNRKDQQELLLERDYMIPVFRCVFEGCPTDAQ